MGKKRRKHRKGTPTLPQRPRGSLLGIYVRLMRQYAIRHWIYLTIGVFFALVEGGALLTLCKQVGMVASGFESGRVAKGPKAAEVVETRPGETPPVDAAVVDASTQLVDAEEVTPNQELPPPARGDKQSSKIQKYVDQANTWLRKFGLPEVDKGDGVHFTRSMVILLLVGLVAFFIIQALAILGNRYCLKWLGARVVTDMRRSLYNHLLDQSQSFYSREDVGVGSLISRCTNDINAVESVISGNFPDLVVAPIQILAAGFFLVGAVIEARLSWSFAVMVLLMGFVMFPLYWVCRLIKRYQHRVLEGVAAVTDKMQESYSGIRVIRAFRQEEREKESFNQVNEKYFKSLCRAIRADVAVHPMLQIAAMIMVGIFVWMCYLNGLTIGVLSGMAFAAQSMYKPIKDIVKVNAGLQKGAAAAERFFEVLDLDSSLPVPDNPRRISSFDKEIRFDSVSFRYTSDGMEILQGIDFTIRKGEMVALVGQTGSGKSTLAYLLARFYDPTAGRVTIDGVDLRELDVTDFRNLVGIVSQDTFLFNTSIEENIRYGRPDATHEEVVEAARQANALEFIEENPEGFARKVGERGDLLSGGQKQRIAIARAILRNPPILILDEATSALDTVTEKLVQDALNNVMKDRTVLAIAHRLSTVRDADCILVMEDGRVVERGTDSELRAQGGIYNRLASLQFDNADPSPRHIG